MAHILSIGSGKGGTGKSSLAFSLGHLLAERQRVLLVDCDAQASLTEFVGASSPTLTLADVVGGAHPGKHTLREVILPVSERLSIVPSGPALFGAELAITGRLGRESILAKALSSVADEFELVLLDLPPAINLMSINALTASNAVLIPFIPEYANLAAARTFLDAVEQVRETLNPGLKVLGFVATLHNSRLLHHTEALNAMREGGLEVLPVSIGRSVRLADAVGMHKPLTSLDPDNPRSHELRQLAEVIQQWAKAK